MTQLECGRSLGAVLEPDKRDLTVVSGAGHVGIPLAGLAEGGFIVNVNDLKSRNIEPRQGTIYRVWCGEHPAKGSTEKRLNPNRSSPGSAGEAAKV
jgi:hypothetical protein